MERVQLDSAVRVILLLAVMVAPSTVFQGTQSLSAILALLLLFAAWEMYVRFTRAERTDAGFVAALVVALAFFANFYAPFFAAAFAVSAPLFTRPRSRSHLVAMLLVLVFPSVAAVGGWMYLSWLFTGDGLRFVYDPNSSLMAAFRPEEAFLTTDLMLRESLRRALSTPLYLGVGVLIARYHLRRLPAYAIPVVLNFGAWSLGWAVPLAFDRSLRLLFAVAGIPGRVPRKLGGVLVVLALLQVVADGSTLMAGEPGRWWRALAGGPLPEDQVEQRIGRELRRLPCGSVLADDREAYRLIARAGTACPFVLPPDPIFEMAVTAPARFVSHVLVAEQPRGSGPLEWRYRTQPPRGFVAEFSWPGWRLYRRLDSWEETRAESGGGPR